ncbi:MAG: hypothetical protein ACKV2U_16305 [Bryobacteraceae bacterium]
MAQRQLAARQKLVAGIRTVADAERETGRIDADGYVIETIQFESLPDFFVTANAYRPLAPGRYPAVPLQAGHTQEGKPDPQVTAANLALQGYVALTGGSVNEYLADRWRAISFGMPSAQSTIW